VQGGRKTHTKSGKPGKKKPFGRRRRRMEDNIKMGIIETGCENVD
jgi:hypothetical protein